MHLDYLTGDGRTGRGTVGRIPAATELANQANLLAAAARLRRLFVLPVPDAPGAVFVGAEVAPAAFDLPAPDGPAIGVSGIGLSLRDAFERCVGEAAEYLSMIRRGDEVVTRATVAAMVSGGEGEPDPADTAGWYRAGLGLAAETGPATGRDQETGIEWLSGYRLHDGAPRQLPADLCLRRPLPPGDPVRRPAESNGHAVAATPDEALRHALLEVVERDATALWWFARQPADRLDPATAEAVGLDSLLDRLRAGRPERSTWVLELTSDLGIPVMAALSSDAAGRSVVIGVSAKPDAADAVRAAVLEMCQMEVAQRIVFLKRAQNGPDALNRQDRHVIERARTVTPERFPHLLGAVVRSRPRPAVGAGRDPDASMLADRLRGAGFTALAYQGLPSATGIPAARVLVPGLQSMRLDWVSRRFVAVAARNGVDVSQAASEISLF